MGGLLPRQHRQAGRQGPRPGGAARGGGRLPRRRQLAVAAEFTEVESGKKNDRPELAKALATCRRTGATLIIAKLDGLARNVAFVSNLMEAGVEFTAVDIPTANRLTIHILAAVAEHEREMISARTKAALAAAKARGTRLGNPHGLTAEARTQGTAVAVAKRKVQAADRAADLAPIIAEIKASGRTSLRAIAAELDARGIPAPRGGRWTAPAVMRLTAADLETRR